MAFSLLGMGVCSQISVDTFGSRFSTLNAKTCRPPSNVPNLIDASVSTQKGRKGNDQHVHRQFYTPAAPRRVQHLGYRQDERRIARHRLQVPRPRRLLPEAAREEERTEQARPVQARHPSIARGRRPELAQAATHRQAHMAQAGRRARRRRQRVHRRPLRRRAEEAGPLPGRAVPRPGVGARPGPGRLRRGRSLRFRRPHPPELLRTVLPVLQRRRA